ncbi:MAG: ATP-binding protein [Pseudomonadota bacterium]
MRRLNLGTRLTFALFGVAGLTLLLLYFAAAQMLDNVLLKAEMEEARRQGRLLVPVLQGLARSPEDLDRTLRSAAERADRSGFHLEVLGPELGTLFPSGIQPATAWLGYERLRALAARHTSAAGAVEKVTNPRGTPMLLSLTPLPEQGWLLLAFSLEDLEERRETLTSVLILVSLLSWLLVGLMGHLILRRWVIRPMARVTSLAERISVGEEQRVLDQAIAGREDELGVMGRALSAMARRLANDRGRITDQLAELEVMNHRLTVAKEQLVRSETLASVGSLAAGVAHEIGNPVGIILGYLEMMADDVMDEPTRDIVAKLTQATRRIDRTIRDMLNFARPAADEEEGCFPAHAAKEVLDLLGPQKRVRHVTTTISATPQVLRARIPPSRLKQILVNLLLNAADAMEGAPGEVTIAIAAAGDRVEISVRDTGPGIAPEILDRIFDPFFTTKDPGRGPGLGLFMAHQIIQRYNGGISVQCVRGVGTTFTLDLPAEEAHG